MQSTEVALVVSGSLVFVIIVLALVVCRFLNTKGVLKPLPIRGVYPHKFFSAFGVQCHYKIFSKKVDADGNPELIPGKTVLFLHGLAAQLDQLTWGVDGGMAQALMETNDQGSGFSLVALDLLGHGFSEAPDVDFTPSDFQTQIDALLTHLGLEDERIDVIGFSHGGFVASHFAARRPTAVKHLILMSPFSCWLPCHSCGPNAAIFSFFVRAFFEGNMSCYRTIYRIVVHLEGWRWPEILLILHDNSTPMLVMAGAWDRDPLMRILQNAKRIHKLVPASKLAVMPRGCHMSWATGPPEKQRKVRNEIISFLEDHETYFDERRHSEQESPEGHSARLRQMAAQSTDSALAD